MPNTKRPYSKNKRKKYDENKYYDEKLRTNIIELCDVDLPKATEEFHKYLELYPNDYGTYCAYAANLMALRRFEEAEQVLDEIEYKVINKIIKIEKDIEDEVFYSKLHFTRLKLLCYQGKYQECLDYYTKYRKIIRIKGKGFQSMIEYCNTQMGIVTEHDDPVYQNYIFQQIYNYSDEEFRKHIQKHLCGYKKIADERIYGNFFEEFPIDTILEELKKYIPNEEKGYCFGFYEDNYYFKYDDCGRSVIEKERNYNEDKGMQNYKKRLVVTDYFKVSAFHNSSNLITLSPCEGPKGLKYVDLNYLKKQEPETIREEKPIQRKSQIDKFNERYQKKLLIK